MYKKVFIPVLLSISLAGCKLGPHYQKPVTQVPTSWKQETALEIKKVSLENWWDIFEDSELSALEKALIEKNYDLYIAMQKVCEARALAGVSKADLYPQLTLNANYNFFQDFVRLYQTGKQKLPGIKDKITINGQNYLFPNLLSYELDLFGKYRSNYQAAVLNADSYEHDMRSTLLTLTSELAAFYFNLRALDQQTFLLTCQKNLLEEKYQLQSSRYEKGLASLVEVVDVESNIHLLQASIEQTLNQRALIENAIATLIGKPASIFSIANTCDLSEKIPLIPSLMPSKVLVQRPDIAAMEKKAESKHAQVRSSYLSFFPDLNITSGLGYASLQLKEFLNIKSFLWQAGAGLAQTIFDGKRKKSDLEASWARFRQAEAQYKLVVLKAFEEVESALSSVEKEKVRSDALKTSLAAIQKKQCLTEKKFSSGIANKLDLIDSSFQVLDIKQKTVSATNSRYQATIDLIKSLGGKWSS